MLKNQVERLITQIEFDGFAAHRAQANSLAVELDRAGQPTAAALLINPESSAEICERALVMAYRALVRAEDAKIGAVEADLEPELAADQAGELEELSACFQAIA